MQATDARTTNLTSTPENRSSFLLVVLAGCITTILTGCGVWWLDTHTTGWHVMGWYADYVIPAGAVLVGFAAGSGYGLASWRTGLKIRRSLLLVVLCLQCVAYFTAEYVEYRVVAAASDAGPAEVDDRLSFPEYFHLKTISLAWDNHGAPGEPIGQWGYFFTGLALLGFAAGGVVAPAWLRKVSYCELCQRYMASKRLALIPASIKPRKIPKSNIDALMALEVEQKQASDNARAQLRRVEELNVRRDGSTLSRELREIASQDKQTAKLPVRIAVSLVHCGQCANAFLQPECLTGHGKQQRKTRYPASIVGREVAAALLARDIGFECRSAGPTGQVRRRSGSWLPLFEL
jgi:hypothetical protein